MRRKRNDDTIRINAFGYQILCGRAGTTVQRDYVNTARPGDYGCDPLPDGRFRMVPSGDVVTREEKEQRLRR